FLKDLGGRAAQLPVDVAQLDAADQVFLVLAAEADARARIDRLELRHVQDAFLDTAHERVALDDRQIAAGPYLQGRLRRLRRREELEAATERGVCDVRADEEHGAGEQHLPGMLDEPAARGDIAAADGAEPV